MKGVRNGDGAKHGGALPANSGGAESTPEGRESAVVALVVRQDKGAAELHGGAEFVEESGLDVEDVIEVEAV